jgi:hypothetical protein
MTISAGSPSQPPRGARQHRHSKSVSSVAAAPHTPVRPPHAALQLQSPQPRQDVKATPRTPSADASTSKKRRRQRKPKDATKDSPARPEAPPTIAALSQASPDRFMSEITPTKATTTADKAYAGPTFHHSPAPSSLPMPKFFSNSVPVRRTPGLQAMMEEDYVTDTPQASTPLERLFRADREERARKSRQAGESSDSDSTPDGRDIFGMDLESPTRTAFASPPSASRSASDGALNSMFSMDSLYRGMPGHSTPAVSSRQTEEERRRKAEALHQLLLKEPKTLSTTPVPASPSPASRGSHYQSVGRPQSMVSLQGSPLRPRHQSRPSYGTVSPQQSPRHHYTPPQPQAKPPVYQPIDSTGSQLSNLFESRVDAKPCAADRNNFTDMENSLRQILKLDPRPSRAGGVMI